MTTLNNALTASQQAAYDAFLKNNPARSFRFELLEAGANMPVLGEGNIVKPEIRFASRSLSGETTFASTEGDDVRFVYSKRSERVTQPGGAIAMLPVPESIWFEAAQMGRLEVPRNAGALLIRMLFSNECQNGINPAKQEPLQGYSYKLIQPEKTAADRAAARSVIIRVQAAIDTNTPEENVRIARRLEDTKNMRFDYNAGPDALRLELIDAAATEPEAVHAASSDNLEKAKALIEEAAKGGLLTFKHETREWVYATGQVLQVIPTGEPLDGLATWLLDAQGTTARVALKKQVEDRRNGKGEKKKGIRLAPGEAVPEGYNPQPGKLGMHWPLNDE